MMSEKYIVYYYAFFISVGFTFAVVISLILYIRKLKSTDQNSFQKDVQISEDFLKRLHLDAPHLGVQVVKRPSKESKVEEGDVSRDPQKELDESYNQINFSQDNNIGAFLKNTKIKDVMIKDPKCVNEDTKFSVIPRLFNEHRIRHLPVVGANNKIKGLISERDMYKISSPRRLMDGTWYYDDEALNGIVLKHVMHKDPMLLTPDDCLGDALVGMVYAKLGCIPIINEHGSVIGILTRRDILKIAAKAYLAEVDE